MKKMPNLIESTPTLTGKDVARFIRNMIKTEKSKLSKKDKEIIKTLSEEFDNFNKTGIPRCQICKKPFVKITEQSGEYHSVWKPDCDCIDRNLRICIG